MKIAFLVGEFPALSQTFILNQITGLIDRGHDVDIYAPVSGDEPKIHSDVEKYNLLERTFYSPQIPKNYLFRTLKGIRLLLANSLKEPVVLLRSLNVFKYGKQAASLRLFYSAIPLLYRRSPYDIVHCHFGPNGLKGSLLQDIGALQGKLVTAVHGYDMALYLQRAGESVYNQLYDKGDLFLPISERWKRRLIELGCPEKKILVHRMGIDCKRFSFTPRHLQADRRVRLVSIGRLVEKKGVEYAIRAVAKLAKVNPNIEYHVVGDGPMREDLQRLIQELDVDNAVTLHGWKQQQEIVEILNNAHIMLAPSVTSKKGDQEGIPVVLMEAMAMGLPIVSTQHSGIPELIQHGISGLLVPERDVNALSEKLGNLIEHPEVWSEMGRAGRRYVEEYYDIDKLNDQLVKIYEELLTYG